MTVLLSQYLLLLTSVLSLTAGTPTPADLAPRACSTARTINISRLDKNNPDANNNGQTFALSRTGGPGSNTIKSVISFTFIPEDATGCMLQIDIPKQPTRSSPTGIARGSGTQSDVWLLKTPADADPTDSNPFYLYNYSWNQPPEKNQFVSTTVFPPGETTDEPYKTFLWSGTCDPTMSFQFELSDWQQESGDVEFFNLFGGKEWIDPFKLKMIYNC